MCIRDRNYTDYAKKYNKKTNKLIDSLYEDNGIKINFISNWIPDDNIINYKEALKQNKEIDLRHNEEIN